MTNERKNIQGVFFHCLRLHSKFKIKIVHFKCQKLTGWHLDFLGWYQWRKKHPVFCRQCSNKGGADLQTGENPPLSTFNKKPRVSVHYSLYLCPAKHWTIIYWINCKMLVHVDCTQWQRQYLHFILIAIYVIIAGIVLFKYSSIFSI